MRNNSRQHIKNQINKLNEKGKYKKPKPIIPPLTKKYISYELRAQKKKIPFELTIDDFDDLLRSACVYCGTPATVVDRIDSKGGYTKDNSQPCCVKCNMMKYVYSHDEFMDQVARIYQHMGKL